MIIVEGPDGAGKTTLIQKLQYDFPSLTIRPRFCTSTGGPIEELSLAVYRDYTRGIQEGSRFVLYDRHPIISEYIYGHDIPERHVDPAFLDRGMAIMAGRIIDLALVVWCRPPLEVIKANLDPDHEMPGVDTNIDKIYESYQIRELMWPGKCVKYDFTDQESYWTVRATIGKYLRGHHV